MAGSETLGANLDSLPASERFNNWFGLWGSDFGRMQDVSEDVRKFLHGPTALIISTKTHLVLLATTTGADIRAPMVDTVITVGERLARHASLGEDQHVLRARHVVGQALVEDDDGPALAATGQVVKRNWHGSPR